MKRQIRNSLILLFSTLVLFQSCSKSSERQNIVEQQEVIITDTINEQAGEESFKTEEYVNQKISYYSKIQYDKNFKLEAISPCDDALEDSIHKRRTVYVDSIFQNSTRLICDFKFIDACCQDFMGDYEYTNHILVFNYEQVNDEVCDCLCMYKYRLTINNDFDGLKSIKFNELPYQE